MPAGWRRMGASNISGSGAGIRKGNPDRKIAEPGPAEARPPHAAEPGLLNAEPGELGTDGLRRTRSREHACQKSHILPRR